MKNEFLNAIKLLQKTAKDIIAPDLEGLAKIVKYKIENDERYIIVLGETSCGKSTLVNSLINRPLIPTSSIPTTGQIVQVSLSNDSKDKYFKIDRSGNPKEISYPIFRKLACSNDENILELRANISADNDFLDNSYILDTPGYNSVISKHPVVFSDFVPQSDAIIYVINYRKGLTQTDLPYIESIYQEGKAKKQVYFVLNFKDDTQPDKKTRKIRQQLASRFNYSGKIYIPSYSQAGDQDYLELPNLCQDILQYFDSPHRHNTMNENHKHLLLMLVDKFTLRIHQIEKIDSLTSEDISVLEKNIKTEKKLSNQAKKIIKKTYAELSVDSQNEVNNFFIELLEKSREIVDKQNKWTEPLTYECTEYLKNQLFPTECRAFSTSISNFIQERLMNMAESLDELVDASFKTIEQFTEIKGDRWLILKEKSVRYGLSKLAGSGARKYLSKLGGRGGYRAGFVNFAKKAVSRGGKLIRKKFSRQVYYNMGRMLKKFGLSAERAIGAFVYAFTEIAVFLGKVAIWKSNLRKNLQQTAEEQKKGFLNDIKSALRNSEDENNALIEEIFEDRLNLIQDLLKRRKKDFKVNPSIIKHSRKILDKIREELT